jgi:hypothetical protein
VRRFEFQDQVDFGWTPQALSKLLVCLGVEHIPDVVAQGLSVLEVYTASTKTVIIMERT